MHNSKTKNLKKNITKNENKNNKLLIIKIYKEKKKRTIKKRNKTIKKRIYIAIISKLNE